MIPKRLELRNFLSYGDQVTPLDFSGMHLVCLSGENGNGKSAILDAITWALWGEARGSSDELIRLGADEMRVVFDFELNGDLYRVIRGRGKRNSANVWELYITDESGCPRPITGQGMRDTGAKIQRILRMDYKTFVNSAYIQQGHADEFTKQSVGDRKKILADILDLGRYDELEQKAKERRNEADQAIGDLERGIASNECELASEAGWKQELESAQRDQKELESRITASEAKSRELVTKQAELEAASRKAEDARTQIESLREEISGLQARRSEQDRRIASWREIIDDRRRILDGIDRLKLATETIALLDRQLEDLRSLRNDAVASQMKIGEEKRRLEMDRQNLEKQLADMKLKVDEAARLKLETEPLRVKASELDSMAVRLSELNRLHAEMADQHGELRHKYDAAVEQKTDLDAKRALFSKPGAKCPLCLTELGHDKHEAILVDYGEQIEDIDQRIADLKKQGAAAKSGREAAKKEIDETEAKLRSGRSLRDRISQADHRIAEAEKVKEQYPAAERALNEIAEKLASEAYAQEHRNRLAEIEAKVAGLGYDEGRHRLLREELPNLRKYESLAVKLKHAEENIAADEANLLAISELIAAREKSVAEHQTTISGLSQALKELEEVNAEIRLLTASLQELRSADRALAGKAATLEQSLLRCGQLRGQIASSRTALEKAKKDKAIYSDLMAAFGKKGVQALIIENAVPEIQEEANQLLARMTDNAMQVSIETVRDKKTGGTAETLDIRISDDMGTRAYELYSGGEAFRVNFALRIALSRLLARRAGAKLQTLIIDEGFGTQDGKGREKLIEAIDSIKEDFELILVISHIDELKDAFPTRIGVTKDALGSQLSVN